MFSGHFVYSKQKFSAYVEEITTGKGLSRTFLVLTIFKG